MSQPLTNLTKAATTSGKLQPTEANAPAEWLEAIAASMFHIGAKCKRAYQALKERKSKDEDFLSDQEIKDRLDFMREKYLEARAETIRQLTDHVALRAIHYNRAKVANQLAELKAAEAKYL